MSTQDPNNAKPKLSSTVLLARDGERGIEVFMVARNKGIKFASGALVFPGGKMDEADQADAAAAAHAGGERYDATTLGLRASAVREVFEETGILLAKDASSGERVAGERADQLQNNYRDAVYKGEITMAEIAARESIVFATDELAWFAHWITPAIRPTRFDTYFYLAAMPSDQRGHHDGGESVDSTWITARHAEEEIRERGFAAMFPTMLNLELLGDSDNVADAIDAANQRSVATVQPTIETNADGEKRVTIPSSAGYRTTSYPFEAKWGRS